MLFSEEERRLLLNTPVVTAADTDLHLHRNRMFLLSEEQVLHYLPTKKERRACATGFAVFGGGAQMDGSCFWWTLPYEGHYPQAVYPDGTIRYHGRNVAHGDWCIRPAIRVSADTLRQLPHKEQKSQKHEAQQRRVALDDQRVYFLSAFIQDGRMTKISVDKEFANDSHYDLDLTAAQRLRDTLRERYGSGDLVALLRKFFQTESDHGLVTLLHARNIPFKQFHFD